MSTFVEDVRAFVELVASGRSVEAMERFYADDVEMRENDEAPRVGKVHNLENERRNLSSLREPPKTITKAVTFDAEQGVSMVEWHITFVPARGKPTVLEEVAVQRWRGRQIVSERFYYRGFRDAETA